MASELEEGEYLVCCDYGMEGVWAVVRACSAAAIVGSCPEPQVCDGVPSWMAAPEFDRIRSGGVVDLDAGPIPGWLALPERR